jgi:hypothetical protein
MGFRTRALMEATPRGCPKFKPLLGINQQPLFYARPHLGSSGIVVHRLLDRFEVRVSHAGETDVGGCFLPSAKTAHLY